MTMKRKQLHESKHPFDPCPFEALWDDSWHPVERLRVSGGALITCIVDDGQVTEENTPSSHLRVKSRKATCSDCTSFLRPGVDVCVLSSLEESEKTDDDEDEERVWIDAKIRSIERKPHDEVCDCQFYVSFYLEQGPELMINKKLSKQIHMVKIEQISILQKLERRPCEDRCYRWSFSEDASSLQKHKLFSGKFSADVTWLLVTSLLMQTVFEVRTIQNRIVYETLENVNQPCFGTRMYAVNFKVDDGILTPTIVEFDSDMIEANSFEVGPSEEVTPLSYDLTGLRRSKRRNVQPERYLACDNLPEYDVNLTRFAPGLIYKTEYEEMPLVLSVQADHAYQEHGDPEKWGQYGDREQSENSFIFRNGVKSAQSEHPRQKLDTSGKKARKEKMALVPVNDASETDTVLQKKNPPDFEAPRENAQEIGDIISKYVCINYSPIGRGKRTSEPDFMEVESGFRRSGLGKKTVRRSYKRSSSNSLKRDCFYVRDNVYDVRSFRKGSTTARVCRELIKRCMDNIDATINQDQEHPPVIDQWKEFQSTKYSNEQKCDDEKLPTKNEEELSELDMLWKEMDLALASLYLLDDHEDSHGQTPGGDQKTSKEGEKVCQHDYRLNEQVGIVCRLCGSVSTGIKDVVPPFAPSVCYNLIKEQKTEEDSEHKEEENQKVDQYHVPASSTTHAPAGGGEENVWALIPHLSNKLRLHQKRAFEFLWRNIAGSLKPALMEEKKKKRGGCVISHSPGAGKTLLIIAFLASYLKLFPGSRPLVLAPKTTLYTWYKEIIKWEIPIPVYQIHGGQTYKGEVLRQRVKLAPGLPRNQDVLHVLDCLEKIQRWLSHPSVLLMGYTSFLTLTREDSNYAHRKYMAQLLRQCPGILILDEGHNPRSTKSRLRKALMKVKTQLRVLLSGTLFQNNFGEYFNTLSLARPKFVGEVLKKLDPKYKKRKKDAKTQFSLENRARKLFIDKISRRIDSNVKIERDEGLNILKNLTNRFIDVYEGGTSDQLPGLQCYTLMMKSTSLQQEILEKLQNQRPVYKGFPLELELLITLGAIHPWLIRTTACSSQYFSQQDLEDLEQFKFDLKCGSKVRFVMSLIPRCILRKEKVLIFCHNIAPINLFLKIFERFYGWQKGKEVMVLQGDIELFERGRVIDKFEEPGGPSRVMLASITACAEGISLTAASRVILLDSEWNPSKSKQAIARAFRPGQNKVVYVYQLLATGTLEEEKYSRTTWKEWVSCMIFSEEHVDDPSHWQAPKIEDELLREIVEEDRGALFHKIMKNEKASNVIRGKD